MTRCLLIAIPILAPWIAAAPLAADPLADTLETIRPSVVGIGYTNPVRGGPELQGTGFAVGDGRHVLTNAHVVNRILDEDEREQFVVFTGRGSRATVRIAERIATDEDHDLALLRIAGDPLPALRIGDSNRVREGEACAFTGFPIGSILGLYPATHRATIAAITPLAAPLDRAGDLSPRLVERLRNPPPEVFQLDATAYPGNSGSPLFDPRNGEVIGIINSVLVKDNRETVIERPSGIAFAIPIGYARDLLEGAGLNADPDQPPEDGQSAGAAPPRPVQR